MSFLTIDTAGVFEFGPTSAASLVDIVSLTPNKFVYIYEVNEQSGPVHEIRAQVCNISGDNIIVNSETVLYSEARGDTYNFVRMGGAIAMTSESIVVVGTTVVADLANLSDRTQDLFLIPCLLSGSGNNFLVGGLEYIETGINAHNVTGIGLTGAITGLSASSGALPYYIGDGTQTPNIIHVVGFSASGNTATVTANSTIDVPTTVNHLHFHIASINSTTAILGWHNRNTGDPDHNKYLGVVATYTGASFTFGAVQELGPVKGAVPHVNMSKQDSSHFVLLRDTGVRSFSVSGTTVTGGTEVLLNPLPAGTTAYGFHTWGNTLIRIDNTQMLTFYADDDDKIRAAHLAFSGTTITRTGGAFDQDFSPYNPANFNEYPLASLAGETEGAGVIFLGGNRLILALHADKDFTSDPNYGDGFWDFGGLVLLETTLFDIEYTTLYLIGVSVAGDTAFVTAWADGVLILNIISLSLGAQTDSIILGTASLAQVQAKTYIAYPCAINGTTAYIYGRIASGAGLAHVMLTTDTGSNFTVIESGWGTDYAGAMVCRGVGDFFAMRCNASSSKLYQTSGVGVLGIKSTLPFAGPVEPHGLRLSPWDESLVAAVDKAGEAQTVVFSYPPYLAWQDITLNHPQTEVNAISPL